jgi:hypothetical protein
VTIALCLRCGHSKFGALCPCPKCGMGSTGDMQLDIAFSDHRMSQETIANLGKVIAVIREAANANGDADAERDSLCFWSFITYISRNHSSILHADAPPELSAKVNELLARITFPPVEIVPPPRSTTRNEPDDSVTIELPEPLATEIRHKLEQPVLATVDLRLRDGRVAGPYFLICDQVRVVLIGKRQRDQVPDVAPTDVAAVRLRFSLVAPFRKRPWIGG